MYSDVIENEPVNQLENERFQSNENIKLYLLVPLVVKRNYLSHVHRQRIFQRSFHRYVSKFLISDFLIEQKSRNFLSKINTDVQRTCTNFPFVLFVSIFQFFFETFQLKHEKEVKRISIVSFEFTRRRASSNKTIIFCLTLSFKLVVANART